MVKLVEEMLSQLAQAEEKSFRTLYTIQKAQFHSEIFAEQIVNNRLFRTSYDALYGRCESVGAGLAAAVGGGDGTRFVGIYMDNSPLWVACFWGALMAGYKPLLLNTRHTAEETAAVLADCKPACVLTDGVWQGEGALDASAFAQNATAPDTAWADEIALLTSGTTGAPRVVVYDGAAICAQVALSGGIVAANRTITHNRKLEIKLLAFLPFYHIFGLIAVLLWFSFFGRTLVFIRDNAPRTIQFACKRHGVTHFFAVPLVWDATVDAILEEVHRQGKDKVFYKAIDFSNKLQSLFPLLGGWFARRVLFASVRRQALGESLHFCISGGSFVREETRRVLNGLGYRLYVGYGLTEAGIVSVELSLRNRHRLGASVGKPFACVQACIGENGELLLDSAVLHRAVYEGGVRREREAGEMPTRDLARIGADGRLEILGRRDETIIGAGGENLSPALIEQKLRIAAAQSCVLGLPDDAGNDRVVLIVYFAESTPMAARAAAVQDAFDQIAALPVAQRPVAVYAADAPLPVTSTEKIKRAAIGPLVAAGRLHLIPLTRSEAADIETLRSEDFDNALARVKAVFARVLGLPVEQVSDTADFIADLGGDSLKYYALISALSEEFGTELTLDSSAPVTPADFAARFVGR